jgi:Na+/pantothenate symporter
MGIVGFIAMLAAPPAFLNFISILGTGTLQAAMAGPVFFGTLWRGNSIGAIASMLGGGGVAGCLLLFTDMGWIASPLIGDVVGIILYVGVSKLTFEMTRKGAEINQEKVHYINKLVPNQTGMLSNPEKAVK